MKVHRMYRRVNSELDRWERIPLVKPDGYISPRERIPRLVFPGELYAFKPITAFYRDTSTDSYVK